MLSSYPSNIDKVDIGREFSDHCLVLFHVLLVPAATQSRTRKIFLYNNGDYDQLRATLSDFRCTFFNSSPEANSVDANWNNFTQAISAAIDECIPSKLTSNRNKRPAWLNALVRKLIRKRDHLAKVAKKTGLTIDRDRYCKARNKAPAAIEAGYRDHLNTILGNVVSDPRAFY